MRWRRADTTLPSVEVPPRRPAPLSHQKVSTRGRPVGRATSSRAREVRDGRGAPTPPPFPNPAGELSGRLDAASARSRGRHRGRAPPAPFDAIRPSRAAAGRCDGARVHRFPSPRQLFADLLYQRSPKGKRRCAHGTSANRGVVSRHARSWPARFTATPPVRVPRGTTPRRRQPPPPPPRTLNGGIGERRPPPGSAKTKRVR